MPTSRADLIHPPRRLPYISLPALVEGTETPLIWRRTAPILLLLHDVTCAACRDYAGRVAAVAADIAEWDGRPLIIVPEATTVVRTAPMPKDLPFPILEDRGTRLRTALRATPPAVVIGDQWGEIYERVEAGEAHRFPEPAELVDWAKVIATKCPECEGEAF